MEPMPDVSAKMLNTLLESGATAHEALFIGFDVAAGVIQVIVESDAGRVIDEATLTELGILLAALKRTARMVQLSSLPIGAHTTRQ